MMDTVRDTEESEVIALVVEDNEPLLNATKEFLKNRGFTAFGVSSYQDAVREFRSVPRVDMVVTDINLSRDSRFPNKDTSGVTLAHELRAISSELPIYGYSAIFEKDQLSDELFKAFTAYYPKGMSTLKQLEENAATWTAAAVEHRDQRLRRARQDLERLRASYQMGDPKYSTLRDLTPGSGTSEDQDSIEEVLARAGYRIKLIEPGRVRPRIERADATTRGPIVLWIRESGGTTIAEVYAYPDLYGHGESEESAIADVLLLMDGYAVDLHDVDEESLSLEVLRLRNYLNAVLEA
jgi:CheY-like chemotaxis protein